MRFLHGHMHIAFSEYDWDGEGENLQYVLVYSKCISSGLI